MTPEAASDLSAHVHIALAREIFGPMPDPAARRKRTIVRTMMAVSVDIQSPFECGSKLAS
jgi:hypothetical protein